MLAIKNLWFTLKSLFTYPERTFPYIVDRVGDSHKNLLIATAIFARWLIMLFFTKHDTMLGFLFGSLFLLPIGYFIALYMFKLGASILVLVIEKFRGTMDEFTAELILIYTFLPIAICSSLLSVILFLVPFAEMAIIIGSKIFQFYLLFLGLSIFANLSRKKTIWASITFIILPYLISGLIVIIMAKFSH
ncbi:hypothetical protein ABIB40_003645 [Pedobacter sp. UYP30]|uniref:YIP1 family protein n=1 Tax=Pedobacter sp. UYP30 TaxID=1756400 RepID=UPI0033999959